MCAVKLTTFDLMVFSNPLRMESAIIKLATPSVTPRMAIMVIKETNPLLCFEVRCRRAINWATEYGLFFFFKITF